MRALLLVDLQNDFMPGGTLAVPDGDAVVPVANALMPKFALVVATQDWHPADHGSFAVNHPGKAVGDMVDLGGVPQLLWPAHCVQDTPGAAFHVDVRVLDIDEVVRKGIDRGVDSYSTFYDNARKRETGLDDYLKSQDVDEIVLMGLATDYCVQYSVLDAVELGYAVTVVRDGCRGIDVEPGDVDRAWDRMREVGAALTDSGAILATAD